MEEDDDTIKQNTVFYEEKLEADSYNAAMIDELFIQQKFKLTKQKSTSTLPNTEKRNDDSSSLPDDKLNFEDSDGSDDSDFAIREDIPAASSRRSGLIHYNPAKKDKKTGKAGLKFINAFSNVLHINKEQKVEKNDKIEYFDSLLHDKGIDISGMLTFKNQPVFKVGAGEAKFDNCGMINFGGVVFKRRAETSKFHDRYMVLRGFNLYWYKKADATEQKGICPIPSQPIGDIMVGTKKCFVLEKEVSVKESRRLVF